MTPWSSGELRLTAERSPTGTATSVASTNAVRPSSRVAGMRADTTEKAGSRKWIERPKSPRRMLPRKTAYCTGSGRSRPSSARTRKISLRGASGGSSSGTGSPDSRMTTKTTVETSHSAIRARTQARAEKADDVTHEVRAGAPAAPARAPLRPGGT